MEMLIKNQNNNNCRSYDARKKPKQVSIMNNETEISKAKLSVLLINNI